jgi:hypothetical protein
MHCPYWKHSESFFGIAGGDEKTVHMSLNYFKDNGIVHNQDYNRNVLRVNLTIQLTKNIISWGCLPLSTILLLRNGRI